MEKIGWKFNLDGRSKEYFELQGNKIERINTILDKFGLVSHHLDLIDM
jgi:hypothetical protein